MDENRTSLHRLPAEPLPGVSVVATPPATVTVLLFGEVDTFGLPILDAALETVWTESPRRVVVDLTGVDFFSISAVNALLRSRRTARRRGVRFTVRTASRAVVRLLDLSGAGDTIEAKPPFGVRPAGGVRHEPRRGRLTVVSDSDLRVSSSRR